MADDRKVATAEKPRARFAPSGAMKRVPAESLSPGAKCTGLTCPFDVVALTVSHVVFLAALFAFILWPPPSLGAM